jgi:hypothetical protein
MFHSTNRERFEDFVRNTNLQIITADVVSKELNVSKKQAASLLREQEHP